MKCKLKLMALAMACTSIFMSLPASASTKWTEDKSWRCNDNLDFWKQYGQDFNHYNVDDGNEYNANYDVYKLNSENGKISGNLIIININDTTGSAVSVSFDNTTEAAVTVPIDVTTSSAVSVQAGNITVPQEISFNVNNVSLFNFNDIINQYKKQEEKMNEEFNKMQEQFDRAWRLVER